MFCNYFIRMENSKTTLCFFAMVVKIINPYRVAMNKYYYFLKKQGRKLKIQGTNFKICQTYFLPKKEAWFSISYKGLFFARF